MLDEILDRGRADVHLADALARRADRAEQRGQLLGNLPEWPSKDRTVPFEARRRAELDALVLEGDAALVCEPGAREQLARLADGDVSSGVLSSSVVPPSQSRLSSASMGSRRWASTPTSGSSARSKDGWCTAPHATLRRRCIPPESALTRSSARSERSAHASERSTAALTAPRLTPLNSANARRFSRALSRGKSASPCGMTPIIARASALPASWPPMRILPATMGRRPATARISVLFPAPLAPRSATRRAFPRRRSTASTAVRAP